MKDKKIVEEYRNRGIERGKLICKMTKDIHPKSSRFPLYRGCLVIPDDGVKDGNAEAIAYHDPNWKGEEITIENLKVFSEPITFRGQRNKIDIFVGDEKVY